MTGTRAQRQNSTNTPREKESQDNASNAHNIETTAFTHEDQDTKHTHTHTHTFPTYLSCTKVALPVHHSSADVAGLNQPTNQPTSQQADTHANQPINKQTGTQTNQSTNRQLTYERSPTRHGHTPKLTTTRMSGKQPKANTYCDLTVMTYKQAALMYMYRDTHRDQQTDTVR